MATTTTNRNHTPTPDFEAAAERVKKANDRIADAGRKVTSAYLDGVERYVVGLTKAERQLGEQSQFELVTSVLGAHANLTEDVVKASVSATRELIAA
jgi:hypothetical protein